ncbi:DUF6177 family protein [Streptomyces sp. NPDC047043]|uniref:DUF6177 family protein n=1 Tax=Streptomyces sp. NPDC047043 TaxID=3154497 RepID=UPI0033D3A56F
MTKDVIALTPKMPDLHTLLAGLYSGGPDLTVGARADGAVVQLCAPDGRPLVSIEAPLLIQVPGETTRLLDHAVEDGPVWWTEARASTAIAEAARLAGSFAGRLATVLGGTVWPPEAATTDVVPLTTDVSAISVPATSTPAVDVLTNSTAVVIQDRPLVAMTSWLSDALQGAAAADRALQIVTPATARLTLPTRTALRGMPNRWVVQHPEHGYYDGLSGAVLHWKNGTFTPVRDENGTAHVADAFTPTTTDSSDRQLLLTLRTGHPAAEDLVLGSALEAAFRHLTGAPPAGWSTAEPINLPWNTRELTELARARAPRPTWLTAVGNPERPALATVRVLRTPVGVEEDITLALGYGDDETPPLHALEDLAAELAAEHGLVTLLTGLRAGRRDLTVPAHLEHPPIPVAFTLGNTEAGRIGPAHAGNPPQGPLPVRLGPAAEPALHYRLGDGTDPHAWAAFQRLAQHLGQA